MWAEFGMSLFQALLPVIVAGIGYVGHWLARWLQAHTHSVESGAALSILENLAVTVVTNLEQTVVAEMRARSADHELTAADGAAIKAKAVETLKSYYGATGLEALGKALKLNQDTIAKVLEDKIETAVYGLRYPNQAALPVFRQGPATPQAAPNA